MGRISCSRRDGGEAHNKWMTRGGVTMIIIRTFDLTDLFILAQRAKANYLKFTPSPLYSCSFIPPSSHLFPPATWTFSLDMDRILSPHSPEVIAHNHFQWANFFTLSLDHFLSFSFRENWFSWDLYDINEPLVSNCASYSAFERYTSGTDLYILPHTSGELLNLLWAWPISYFWCAESSFSQCKLCIWRHSQCNSNKSLHSSARWIQQSMWLIGLRWNFAWSSWRCVTPGMHPCREVNLWHFKFKWQCQVSPRSSQAR